MTTPTTAPTTLSEADQNRSFKTALGCTTISLLSIATIVNVASLIFLLWYRHKPIVAMGQPRLLAVMCVGALVMMVGTLLYHIVNFYGKDGDVWDNICKLWFLFGAVGSFMVELILFLKLCRVYKVMQFRRGQTCPPRLIIAPFVAGLIVPVVLAIANAASHESGITDEKALHFDKKCKFDHILTVLWFSGTLMMSVAISVFAWILRHVTESIGDTHRILRWEFLRIIIYIFRTTHFTIVRNTVHTMDDSIDVVLLVLMFFLWVGPAIFLVFPRMYLVWYERIHGHLPDHVHVYGTGNVHVNVEPGTNSGSANADTTSNNNNNHNNNNNTTSAATNTAATNPNPERNDGTRNDDTAIVCREEGIGS